MITLALLSLAAATQPIARTPAQARGVVQRYYAAIDHRDYRTAYRLWSDDGRASGQSYAAFARGFARTAHARVVAGRATDGDAGAGSVFVTIPVQVYATLTSGRRQHFSGSYVLRRVNDVDGATREQSGWHLMSANLRVAG